MHFLMNEWIDAWIDYSICFHQVIIVHILAK